MTIYKVAITSIVLSVGSLTTFISFGQDQQEFGYQRKAFSTSCAPSYEYRIQERAFSTSCAPSYERRIQERAFSASCAPGYERRIQERAFSASCAPSYEYRIQERAFSASCAPEPQSIMHKQAFTTSCAPKPQSLHDRLAFSSSCAPEPGEPSEPKEPKDPKVLPELTGLVSTINGDAWQYTELIHGSGEIYEKCILPSSAKWSIPPVFNNTSQIKHVFSSNEFVSATDAPETMVIVGHGYSAQHDDFETHMIWQEVVPVFISVRNPMVALSVSELRGILTGSITDWSEISPGSGTIKVYLHSGRLQRPKFKALMNRESIAVGSQGTVNQTLVPNYRLLYESAVHDPNALVIGLRGVDIDGLKVVKLDNVLPFDSQRNEIYPLMFPIYIAVRKVSDADILAQELLSAISERDTKDEKLKLLGGAGI